MRLSVVIPTLNEADQIGALLTDLAPLRAAGHGLILVDGGSEDATRMLEARHGTQMNAGARVGSFPDLPLMEDIALSKRLRPIAWPACLRPPPFTSSRRREARGVPRTRSLVYRLRLAYALADPARLAQRYDG